MQAGAAPKGGEQQHCRNPDRRISLLGIPSVLQAASAIIGLGSQEYRLFPLRCVFDELQTLLALLYVAVRAANSIALHDERPIKQ